jgi:hypothetical protein
VLRVLNILHISPFITYAYASQIPKNNLFLPFHILVHMKQVLIGIILAAGLFIVAACTRTSSQPDVAAGIAAIAFDTTEHDYGTLPYAGDGTWEFVFRNTGSEPLLLTNVRSSCGCTIPEWPKEPIPQGGKGTIRVSYNTHLSGTFHKSISVFSNATASPVILKIRGKVEVAAD